MSKRLNSKREVDLESKRVENVRKTLEMMSFNVVSTGCEKGLKCVKEDTSFIIYPYSGWWSGKGIGSGRGFVKLIEKL